MEHRLFAQISSTWRGRPLTSLEVVVETIAATTTHTGLSVSCVLDENEYPTGVTGSWDQIDALPITFGDEPACAAWVGLLTCPDVTGIPQADWDRLVGVLEPAYRQLHEQQALQARGGQPGAYPDRRSRGLKVGIAVLMLAAVLHRRHQLPVMQVSRLIDLHRISVRQHIASLLPLFAQNGFTLDPIGKIRKLEQLCDAVAIPPQVHPTREVTT